MTLNESDLPKHGTKFFETELLIDALSGDWDAVRARSAKMFTNERVNFVQTLRDLADEIVISAERRRN